MSELNRAQTEELRQITRAYELVTGCFWLPIEVPQQTLFIQGWQASREAVVIEAGSGAKEVIEHFEVEEESLLLKAETFVRESGRPSVSAIQRSLKINYESACQLMEKLVLRGVVSPIDSEGRRHVLPKSRKESK